MYLHNTIRKYTLAVLNFFSRMQVQYENSNGNLISKFVPIHYRNKEKAELINKSMKQIVSGNMNLLPRASLNLLQIVRSTERETNKYLTRNYKRDGKNIDMLFNPMPYEFSYDIVVQCRGMSEACQIFEQIAPMFNPNVALDIYDSDNLDEPTRIPMQLMDLVIEPSEFDETSNNLVRVNISVQLFGYLYPPIFTRKQLLDVHMNLGTPNRESDLMEFEVVDGKMLDPTLTLNTNYDTETQLTIEPYDIVKTDEYIEVKYKTNTKEPIEIEFITEGTEIVKAINNRCYLKDMTSEFTICARLSFNDIITSIQKTFNTKT